MKECGSWIPALAEYDPHLADVGTESFERELDESRLLQLREELAAIERAETRLENGTTGLLGSVVVLARRWSVASVTSPGRVREPA